MRGQGAAQGAAQLPTCNMRGCRDPRKLQCMDVSATSSIGWSMQSHVHSLKCYNKVSDHMSNQKCWCLHAGVALQDIHQPQQPVNICHRLGLLPTHPRHRCRTICGQHVASVSCNMRNTMGPIPYCTVPCAVTQPKQPRPSSWWK